MLVIIIVWWLVTGALAYTLALDTYGPAKDRNGMPVNQKFAFIGCLLMGPVALSAFIYGRIRKRNEL